MIQTDRLDLVPLTASQLRLWIFDLPALEKELVCRYRAEPMEGFFLEIVKGQLAIAEKYPEDFMWHSFWLLIRRADRVVVGSADFKGIPDKNHEVEIGYGLGRAFEHRGYMTEAVKAMCGWALRQEGVLHITAETETDGLASQRVLRWCGFREAARGKTLWWRL